ncbi:MAG TPA: hypothetical protein VF714_05770 [Jatrophihabitans sp.]|jgi:hypothetical protein
MHEVVTVTTSLAGAGAVALPAPSTRPAGPGPGAVPAYRADRFATDAVGADAVVIATDRTGGVRAVS